MGYFLSLLWENAPKLYEPIGEKIPPIVRIIVFVFLWICCIGLCVGIFFIGMKLNDLPIIFVAVGVTVLFSIYFTQKIINTKK